MIRRPKPIFSASLGLASVGGFPNQTGQGGVWRPGGSQFLAPEIVFVDTGSSSVTGLEPRADSHLILYDLESQTTQDLTPGEGIEDTSPVFSPDGKFLAFARKYLDAQRWTPGRQLWLAQVDTRARSPPDQRAALQPLPVCLEPVRRTAGLRALQPERPHRAAGDLGHGPALRVAIAPGGRRLFAALDALMV